MLFLAIGFHSISVKYVNQTLEISFVQSIIVYLM